MPPPSPAKYRQLESREIVETVRVLHGRIEARFPGSGLALDYCGEALALISKIAALYVQRFQDTVLLDAADDVEDLTAGLSRKIWQKITILETLGQALPAREPAAKPETSSPSDSP